jgi:hypothetical protein
MGEFVFYMFSIIWKDWNNAPHFWGEDFICTEDNYDNFFYYFYDDSIHIEARVPWTNEIQWWRSNKLPKETKEFYSSIIIDIAKLHERISYLNRSII